MNRAMHRARKKFGFEFLREESFAADLRQRLVENFVALRGDDFFFAVQIGMNVLQSIDHPIGLPAGECRWTSRKN